MVFGELIGICQSMYISIMNFGNVVFDVFFTPLVDLIEMLPTGAFGTWVQLILELLQLIFPNLVGEDVTLMGLCLGVGLWAIVGITVVKWFLDIIN